MKMEAQIRMIDLEQIIPNRFQPRLQFDQAALADLAASIQEHGIIQPLVLRAVGDKFEIIAGERRYKAAGLAGLTEVPAIISNLDDNESAEVAVIENTHRKNLSAIEEAKSYKKLLERNYVTQDQLAKRLGTSQSNIANKVRLLTLDESVQDALINEKISERHARSLLKLTDKNKQKEFLNKIVEGRWTVRKLDEEIDRILASYGKNESLTGGINANNKLDIDINKILNNSTDIIVEEKKDIKQFTQPTFQNTNAPANKSIFFNNLENESVNMSPDASVGFNPFQTAQVFNPGINEDYDILDLDEEDEETGESTNKQKYVEQTLETKDDVIKAIKNIIEQAKDNDIVLELEEFDFDKINQFIIRIDK